MSNDIKTGLEGVAEALREARKAVNAAPPDTRPAPITLRDVTRYILGTDLRSCKQIVDALIERVSKELGCASELEDASCAIAAGIDSKKWQPSDDITWKD